MGVNASILTGNVISRFNYEKIPTKINGEAVDGNINLRSPSVFRNSVKKVMRLKVLQRKKQEI